MPTSSKDTEITLGAGRMLALFFIVVLVCAVFFAIGFKLGRKTMMAAATPANAAPGSPAAIVRPVVGKDTAKPASQPTDSPSGGQAQGQSTPTAAATVAAGSPGSAPPATGAYFVQVAAVNREEDADALVEALKRKQYPAFAAQNSTVDKYYHVQVGPYAAFKDAEAMRARLIADGYNPILKK